MNMPGLNIFIMMHPGAEDREAPYKSMLKKMLADKKKKEQAMHENIAQMKSLMLRGTSAAGGG